MAGFTVAHLGGFPIEELAAAFSPGAMAALVLGARLKLQSVRDAGARRGCDPHQPSTGSVRCKRDV